MLNKKALSFPLWVEAILVAVFLVMAYIEGAHAQWFWATLFGVTGLAIGVSLLARWKTGDKHGGA
jgi:hypothetical protein